VNAGHEVRAGPDEWDLASRECCHEL
jgi:hypothetical protein